MKHFVSKTFSHVAIYLISDHYPVKGGKDGYILTLYMKKKCNQCMLNYYPGPSVEKTAQALSSSSQNSLHWTQMHMPNTGTCVFNTPQDTQCQNNIPRC